MWHLHAVVNVRSPLDEVLVVGVVRQLLDKPVSRQTAAATPHQAAVAHLPGVGVEVSVAGRRRRRDDQGGGGAGDRAAGLDEKGVEQREAGSGGARVADDGRRPEPHDEERNVLYERAAQHQESQVPAADSAAASRRLHRVVAQNNTEWTNEHLLHNHNEREKQIIKYAYKK